VESCASGCREVSVPLPKPNWLEECTFQREVSINGTLTLWYQCPVCLNAFLDPTTLDTLFFLSDDLKYGVKFDSASRHVGPLPADIFELPAVCVDRKPCTGAVPPLNCSRP